MNPQLPPVWVLQTARKFQDAPVGKKQLFLVQEWDLETQKDQSDGASPKNRCLQIPNMKPPISSPEEKV